MMRGTDKMDEYLHKLKDIADYHAESFMVAGHAPNGCNGPYKNNDTPIRNTAHWAYTYAALYTIFKKEKYLDVVGVFAKYLLDSNNYGVNGAAICRRDCTDDTNGVIGQAWVIEGLLGCYDVLHDEQLLNRAISIFLSQELVEETGLWKINCSDGHSTGYDYVYNHNLWFAAAGSQILERKNNPDIRNKVEIFLDHSKNTYGVQPSGCLYHLINSNVNLIGNAKFEIKKILSDFNFGNFKNMNYLEKGYHLFDLYGFALLKKRFPEHLELNSKKLEKAITYGLNEKFLFGLGTTETKLNTYSYPYNSPAFEYPYVSSILGSGCDEEIAKKMLDIQFTVLFDQNRMLFANRNEDPETLTARVYELIRYFLERTAKV